ncbi:MAG TPA: putative Ig domain-containing protein [Vicinamibacterales bacterium]
MLRRVRCVSVVAIGLFVARPALADSVNLAWDPNADTVSGYAVYVGTQSGTYSSRVDVGGATNFTYASATAGQRYCFAVAAYTGTGEGPKSGEVCGYSNRFPTLTNPGNQSSTVGQSVSMQLQGSDPDGQPVSYTATGLPAGLSLGANTGFIAGTGTTTGSFSVTAKVSDGVLTTQQVFTWTMTSGADTTKPSISIATPTSATSYTSTTSTISMSGTSSDNVGVTQVTWTNSLGGSGTATGTTSWSVGSIPLQNGTNVITVVARDAAGNTGNDVLSVAYTATAADTTVPTVSFATPTSGTSYTSPNASMSMSGTSADNVGVTQVTWTNSLGGSGTATGTTSWSVGSVALQSGTNVITVKARDAAGNVGSKVLSVTYTPPVASTSVVLTGQLVSGKWRKYAQLSWTKAPWRSVYVYRNGVRIAKTYNNGSYSDSLRSSGSYTYKVCNSSGVCTNTVTLYY